MFRCVIRIINQISKICKYSYYLCLNVMFFKIRKIYNKNYKNPLIKNAVDSDEIEINLEYKNKEKIEQSHNNYN